MNDSKTEMVGSFGVVSLSRIRDRRKTTSALSFSLVQRLLLAGALLMGLVLSVPAQAQSLVLSASELTIDEGESTTFSVRLDAQPSSAVTVTLTRTGSSDVTFDTDPTADGNQNTLEFSTSNWGAAQSVTVRASEDADRINDTAEINLTGNGNGNGVTSTSLTVTVMDDEDTDVGLTLSLESTAQVVRIDEGNPNPRTLTVRLAAQPGNDRTVTLRSVYSRTTVSPSTLDFTTANWNAPQEFGITAEQDADSVSAPDLIRLEGDGVTAGTVILSTIDYDGRTENRLVVSDASLTVDEGAGETFTVRLGAQPENDRTISLSSGSSAVTVTPGVLNFTRDNWDDPQAATVTAAHDTDQNNESATISLSGFNTADASVAVSVLDDEDTDVGLILSLKSLGRPLGMQEGGSTAFTVRLASRPVNDRTVTLESSSSVVTFNPSALQFTAGNWDEPRELRIIAGQDDDTENNAARVTLGGSGVIAQAIPLIIYDDDLTKIGLTLSATSLKVDEGGTGTFTVSLATTELKDPRVIFLESTKPDVTVSPASLNFTSTNWNATWNAAQTVTVVGVHDDDTANGSATVNLTGGSVTSASLAVTVIDDDVGLTLSSSSLTVDEGASGTFTVKLADEPDGDRTVNLASTETDVMVNPTTLTFTTANWDQEQTVTLTAAQDDDKLDETATINLTGTGIADRAVNVTLLDDDIYRLHLSETSLKMNEGEYKRVVMKLPTELALALTTNLSVSFTSSNLELLVDANEHIPGAQSTFIFTPSNARRGHKVEIGAALESDAIDETATISITVSGGNYDFAPTSLAVTVLDHDFVGIMNFPFNGVSEGKNYNFTVKLNARPSDNVTVTIERSALTDQNTTFDTNVNDAGNQNALTFTPSNWSTPQTVMMSVAHDGDKLDDSLGFDVTTQLGHRTSYGTLIYDDDDDDDVGLSLSSTSLKIDEGGSGTFTVKMDSELGYSRLIALTSTDDDVTISPSKLVFEGKNYFGGNNWNTAQTVTVRAARDSDSTDDTATIGFEIRGQAWPGYPPGGHFVNTATDTVTVTVTEDDDVGPILSSSSLTVNEGSSGTFTVKLDKQPASNQTIPLSSDNADVTVSPAALDFTSTDWNIAQTVSVRAAHDDDAANSSATINLTSTGIADGAVEVTVTDDEIGLVLPKTKWPMHESSFALLNVSLDKRPGSDQTITLGSDNADVTFSPATLTFTAANWSTDQIVTLRAAYDTDTTDDEAVISLEGSGVVNGSVEVTVTDFGFRWELSKTELTMDEGGSATFTVKPNKQPRGGQTSAAIALKSDNAEVTFSPTTLTFTAANWSAAQTVTVRAAEDDDVVDDTAMISSDGVYPSLETVTVTVRDNDAGAAGLSISAIAPEAGNGSTGLFAVRLDSGSATGKLINLGLGGDDVMSGLWSGDGAVLGLGEPGSGVGLEHRVFVAGLGFSNGEMSVSTGNANLHFAQLEHRKNRSNHDGSGQQFDRRRPEDQPHRIPRERHINLGFDHRRRHPTASA
ncbi:MAG: hypothetical protein ISN29_08225 [Gammaproteobacteria bacterium AqS3]|nr:hypothetical protein [Gammaproteobacteria bacterium AqS3]